MEQVTLSAAALATIVYTSGTTGRPNGCQLTHGNFLAELGNITARMSTLFRTGESSVLLFLPLAHVLGRTAEVAAAYVPVDLAHVSDVKDVTAELGAFRPTLILGVPRVFEKVYTTARVRAQLAGRGRIFDSAAAAAIAYSRIDTEHFPTWKQLNGKPADATIADLASDADLLAAIQAAIDDGNQAVSQAEAIHKFRLLHTELTEANGYITPSLKLKRNIVLRDFASEISAMYSE
ncbi:AMP-binding protein [Nocardia gipuzkoensis]